MDALEEIEALEALEATEAMDEFYEGDVEADDTHGD